MTTHYISDRMTKCGLTELNDRDNYTAEYEECTCAVCNMLILKDVAAKLNAKVEPVTVFVG